MSKISNTVTHTVAAGQSLEGFAAGVTYVNATGLEVFTHGATLTLRTQGGSTPRLNYQNGANGVAIDAGTLVGTISTALHSAVTAGAGNYASTLTITQTGSIEPSAHGVTALTGGVGVSIVNEGVITGGAGGSGVGGEGVFLSGGSLINDGVIAGGNGAQAGGAGVVLGGGTLTNEGTISGGVGADAVLFTGAATLIIDPGAVFNGAVAADAGDADVLVLAGSTAATVTGFGSEFTGFGEVSLSSGSTWTVDSTLEAANAAQFSGLAAQDTLDLSGSGSITQGFAGLGTLVLGSGAFTLAGSYGAGGAEIEVESGVSLTIASGISVQPGQAGATALTLQTGGTVNNQGTITGGDGVSFAAPGGAGIYINGGTLLDEGTIAGGQGGYWGASGDAVQFGSLAGTLVIDPGAVFDGQVAANSAVDDVLVLAGNTAGTIGGLGSQYTGFTDIVVAQGASWTLTGGNSLDIGATLTVDGTLTTQGTLIGGAGLSGGLTGGAGGAGVTLRGGVLTNSETITGGNGGAGANYAGVGGVGGAGVVQESGILTNYGTITGGNGGGFRGSVGGVDALGGAGGAGVAQYGGTLTNYGTIEGGVGGRTYYGGGTGGAGVTLAGGMLTNKGTISGGYSDLHPGSGGNGGAGVALTIGTLMNEGLIEGGRGGSEGYNGTYGGAGGAGVAMAGGTVTNDGTIEGGAGFYDDIPGVGGAGVTLTGGMLTNDDAIIGGRNGSGGNTANGDGGVGLAQAGGTVVNDGTITGGYGEVEFRYGFGGAGGAGVSLASGVLTNEGAIVGGVGGAAGYGGHYTGAGGAGAVLSGGTLTNDGTITGGGSTYGAAGAGVVMRGGSLVNAGTITGAGTGNYGTGGAGVVMSGGTLLNNGSIAGAGGGGAGGVGGVGVALSGGTLTNDGMIAGGAGGNNYNTTFGGAAGAGVAMGNGALTNDGTITGGRGGFCKKFAGAGGAGVALSGGSLTNRGVIAGGTGGIGYHDGASGAGVYLNGGTLINAGTIVSGGAPADAVQFGSLAGTLVIDPGAVFIGTVAANSAVDDVLVLAGSAAGTFGGLGSQLTGFTDMVVDSGARWTLNGGNSLAAGTTLTVDGALTTRGDFTDAGHVMIGAAGAVRLAGVGITQLQSVDLQGGKLDGSTAARLVIGGTSTQAPLGAITVQADGTIDGFGTVAVSGGKEIRDNGNITADGGTLNLWGNVYGSGTLTVDGGATLFVHGGAHLANLAFDGAGAELILAGHTPDGTIAGFSGGDSIALQALHATSMSFLGGTLDLMHGKRIVAVLNFTGSFTTANFSVSEVGNSTLVGFVESPHAPLSPTDLAPALAPALAAALPPPAAHAEAAWIGHAETPMADFLSWGLVHHIVA